MPTELQELQALEKEREALLAKHAKELSEIDEKRDTLRQRQLEALKEQAAALGYSITVNDSEKKTRKSSGKRAPLTCRLCKAVGLSGEGHTARVHEKWLLSQSKSTQAKFMTAV